MSGERSHAGLSRRPYNRPVRRKQRHHLFSLVADWLSAISLLGVLGYLIPGLEGLRLLFLLLPLALLARALQGRARAANDAAAPSLPDPPLNQPAGSPARFAARLALSQALVLLNPLQVAQIVAQIVGQAIISIRRALPDTDYAQQARYTLPFRGEWLVYNGGVTPADSHSWDVLTQRYAYDFVIADAALRRHSGDGRALTDYFCYGQDVIAPADGEIITVRDSVRDAPRPGSGWIDFLARDFRGNFVIIKHAEGEYSFLAHLIPGSIVVRAGQRVQRGQLIGRCGNSGHSGEPHLHFHLQDRPSFWLAAGLPVKFDDVRVDGVSQAGTRFLTRGARAAPEEQAT